MTRRVMVVDDEPSIRETFEHQLTRAGYEVSTAASAEAALNQFSAVDPHVVITDVKMPGMSGIELLRRLRSNDVDVDVIVITAHQDMHTAVAAMQAGAVDYLVKPLDLDTIHHVLERCFRERALRRRATVLADAAAEPYGVDQIVGRDARMVEIYKTIGSLARTRTTVLIRGETGTGKELIARAIHYASANAAEPFIAVNCSALPEPLLESELFGHVRGAFTGAHADRRGRFELAGAGTIFLDEIGDTTPAFQTKLLRVLQQREFYPVGGERLRTTEARVLAATHRPLEAMVRDGTFREDLYYRLNVVQVVVPPLRERRDDIPLLVEHCVARLGRELHLGRVTVAPAALKLLAEHDWPGNVRELENVLTRALVNAAPRSTISAENIALERGAAATTSPIDANDLTLNALEREHVRRVLQLARGNKRRACRMLGVSRPRLDRLIEKHRLVVTSRDRDSNDG